MLHLHATLHYANNVAFLCCVVLYCTRLYCTRLDCTVLYYILQYTILCYTNQTLGAAFFTMDKIGVTQRPPPLIYLFARLLSFH